MTKIINWQPENTLNQKNIKLAEILGRSPETIIDEAINEYIEKNEEKTEIKKDPLIGLCAGKPELSTQSEEILAQEIKPKKKPHINEKSPFLRGI
jgi:predicted transcriptional regulator